MVTPLASLRVAVDRVCSHRIPTGLEKMEGVAGACVIECLTKEQSAGPSRPECPVP